MELLASQPLPLFKLNKINELQIQSYCITLASDRRETVGKVTAEGETKPVSSDIESEKKKKRSSYWYFRKNQIVINNAKQDVYCYTLDLWVPNICGLTVYKYHVIYFLQ